MEERLTGWKNTGENTEPVGRKKQGKNGADPQALLEKIKQKLGVLDFLLPKVQGRFRALVSIG